MAGIYIHIPFCKQACHYCNFHFSTSLRHKNELLSALLKEIDLRQDYLQGDAVSSIYLGGGTPSLLSPGELESIINAIQSRFEIVKDAEVTIEANPDDIDVSIPEDWKKIGINRLSIGVQSFFDEDLRWMNRAHDAGQALTCLEHALKSFENITIDLIYGSPTLTDEKWEHNVRTAIAFNIPHLSCYALTVEPRTALQKMIDTGKSLNVDQEKQSKQFSLLMEWMAKADYEHYEISNFAKRGFRSRHNSSYWLGKNYLGIGPSAHSFNGDSRQWNVANNAIYTASLLKAEVPFESELLTPVQKKNEYIMTSLRTVEGIDTSRFDAGSRDLLLKKAGKYEGLIKVEGNIITLSNEGKHFADGIAADLFLDQ